MNEITTIKDFFECYYDLTKEISALPCVPEDMRVDINSDEEWQKWKLIPATITEEDIRKIEKELDIIFTDSLKEFYTTYFHMFEDPIGRHSSQNPFQGMKNAWNPLLVKNGYIPFTWDADGYMIRCIDTQDKEDLEGSVVEIDHEVLFDLDENASREEIEQYMKKIADTLIDYLSDCYSGMSNDM